MKKNKKVALYSPYLDTMGGGEKHIIEILKVFDEYGFEIEILWDDKKIISDFEKKFEIRLSNAKVIDNFLKKEPFFSKIFKTAQYEYFIYVTDGSYFISLAKNNYIFCMYPELNLYKKTLGNILKWLGWKFIVNSNYTKQYIDKYTSKTSQVVYPYLDINEEDFVKEKVILSVGRFFKGLHSKRHDFLIDAFKKIQNSKKEFRDFKLYLVGGLKEEDKDYFNELKKQIGDNKNIFLVKNIEYGKLIELYRKAMFYWHAAGYGVDVEKNPEGVEHLGITPLEAMNYGSVVLTFNAGGPKEIIIDGVNGFLYNNENELIEKTNSIYLDKNIMKKIIIEEKNLLKERFTIRSFKEKVLSVFNI